MNKIKLFSRLVVVLAATNTVVVNAESYVIRPGDALSRIAEKKRIQSGFLLSKEQIMLTLYKLNKDVFVNGNINQLVIAAELLIPDNSTDYIQLSKAEAEQRLRDKSYLRSLVSSASALNTTKTVEDFPQSLNAPQDYTQVLDALNNHQQAIDSLKIENTRLTKKFNLLERAFGRVVLIQGLLTNDMVQVRTKLMGAANTAANPDMLEKSALNDPARIALENKQMVQAQAMLELETQQAAKLENLKPAITNLMPTLENKPVVANNTKEEPKLLAVKRKVMPDNKEDDGLINGLLIGGFLLTALGASWWFLNRYKTRSKKASMRLDPDLDMPADANASAFDLSHFDAEPVLRNEAIAPVKAIIDKLPQTIKEPGRESELSAVLELLDMCLLCGDYQQAHAVTVKALAEHKNSAILAKKLTFIERKMAKL